MPFVESSQSVKSRLQERGASVPIVVGIVALFVVCCVLVVQNFSYVHGIGDLTITREGAGETQLDEAGQGTAAAEVASEAENSEVAAGSDAQTGGSAAPSTEATVFVSGCVVNPGVYELPSDARVDDALEAAGGFAEGAATDAVNLARVIVDGEQIDIPTIEEAQASADAQPSLQEGIFSVGAGSTGDQGLVNINTADAAELQTLPGIGEATASKIIASREAEGPFATTEDLKRVSGIGEKKYEALADLITVG